MLDIDKKLFPLDKKEYIAFGKIATNIIVNRSYSSFHFHILISKKQDNNNYYCLNLETDEMVSDTDYKAAFEKMIFRTIDLITISLKEKNLHIISNQFKKPQQLTIFEAIKKDYEKIHKKDLDKCLFKIVVEKKLPDKKKSTKNKFLDKIKGRTLIFKEVKKFYKKFNKLKAMFLNTYLSKNPSYSLASNSSHSNTTFPITNNSYPNIPISY